MPSCHILFVTHHKAVIMLYLLSWIILCSLWWVAAVSIALPITLLLHYSESLRRNFFAWQFVYLVGPIFQPRTIPCRKKAFEILKANLGKRDPKVPLEIMEIGVGEGPNLQFYPENSSLTVLDVNKYFEGYYYKNTKKFSHIKYKRTVICPAEDMRDVPDKSLDVVVSTYLHCSCNNSDDVLKEVKRVLKPGGKYLFLEHVCYPKNEIGLYLQRMINPIWWLYFGGCNLHRDTAAKIKRAGFADVICDKLVVKDWWMFLVKHEIIGIATV